MKTKFNGILTLLLALIVQISFAQEKTISGTVSKCIFSIISLPDNPASGTNFDTFYHSSAAYNRSDLIFT
jgi:hypothetical protein